MGNKTQAMLLGYENFTGTVGTSQPHSQNAVAYNGRITSVEYRDLARSSLDKTSGNREAGTLRPGGLEERSVGMKIESQSFDWKLSATTLANYTDRRWHRPSSNTDHRE
jgi:hypothetical protein